jgi:hypothetical protein
VNDRPPLWPHIEAWELEDFFRSLRAAVVELEEANRNGTLPERLLDSELRERVGPEIAESYERLAEERSERLLMLRQDAVHALIDQARREIFEIREYASARPFVASRARQACAGGDAFELAGDDSESAFNHGPSSSRLVAARLGNGPEEYLRLDQVVALRFWGIGFVFDDQDATHEVAREIARQTAARLGRDLRHLQKVLLRFRPNDPGAVTRMVPRPEERGFEQLMLDILNEERPCARAAPLSEDFLEKTDLRVRYPGLARRRGGRVQVTQITDEVMHREKLERIRHVNQFVVLSPLMLARFVNGELHHESGERGALEHFDLDPFWHCLPDLPSDVPALAALIKRSLVGALRRPRTSPRGPLAHVPWPLRNVLRLYVKSDVFRATRELREHLSRDS